MIRIPKIASSAICTSVVKRCSPSSSSRAASTLNRSSKAQSLFSSIQTTNLNGKQTSQFHQLQPFNTQIRRSFASSKSTVVKVPGMGDSITEGTIKSVLKKVGDSVKTDDLVILIETDKITVEIRAPESGVISKFFFPAGDDTVVRVGDDLFGLEVGAVGNAAAPAPEAKATAQQAPQAPPKQATPPPQPTQTQAPQQPQQVQQQAPQQAPQKTQTQPQTTAPKSAEAGTHRVTMSRMRQRIAERLKDSQNTAAMLTTFNEVDMSNIMALRDQFKDEFNEKHKVKLGFMSGFVKASAIALKEQPNVNAVIDGKDIIFRDHIDISVAVATKDGLVVPVIRNCEELSFADIEKTIGALGAKARDGKIQLEDMTGGTFTISNGGVYGSMMGTPIINPPQSAILGMHGITKRAVVVNDQIVIRPMMYLALTYDHRLIDGREAVTFLKRIKSIIEDPRRILLDV